jgi:hypothetical protein
MDIIEFKNGGKNHWRRTAWNRIADMASPRDALVLYLPGSKDLDRPEAVRRGFKPANLIAVERDPSICAALRSVGTTTICGNLNDVLTDWPVDRSINVVVADFQCGLGNEAILLADIYANHPALANAVLLVNLQRGRDEDGKWLTDAIQREGLPGWLNLTHAYNVDTAALTSAICSRNGSNPTSRAALFMSVLFGAAGADGECQMARLRDLSEEVEAIHERLKEALRTRDFSPEVRELHKRAKRFQDEFVAMKDWLRVAFLPPYRSAERAPWFDSVVVRLRGDAIERKARWERGQKEGTQRIAAALAIRTRRLRGELPGRTA